jgi:DNA-binding NtrC family response regulator
LSERRLLIVDDEEGVRFPIREFFTAGGYEVVEAASVREALEVFRSSRPDVAILDYSLPDGDGLTLLSQLKELDPTVPVVILTAHGSIDLAVRAIKEGAEQFFTKPVELRGLELIVGRLLEHHRMRQVTAAGRTREARQAVNPFLGESPAIKRLEEQAQRVASSSVPVLILGETGTGKGVLARWLHQSGPRSDAAFVDLNCAGLSRDLLENELFGHQKGAFTGAVGAKQGLLETAHRGTLFLDEIGDVDLQVQGKLLKVIEELRFRRLGDVRDREVDTRLIAATHRDLAALVREERFREDLYYRIRAIPLQVPPLRERGRDVVVLARHLVERIAVDLARPGVSLSAGAERALQSHPWPGNVRELRNALEHAVLLSPRTTLEAEDLRDGLAGTPARGSGASGELPRTLLAAEKAHISRILEEEGWVVPQAAKVLGISRTSLYERIKKHALSRHRR